MFCTQCGHQLMSGSRFCSSCGTPSSPANPCDYPASQILRPRHPRMIAGVCSGIALHYGWDVSIVRLIWALCLLCGGSGLVAYIIAWIVIPEAPYELPAGMPGSPVPPGVG